MLPLSRAKAMKLGASRRPSSSFAPTCFDHSCRNAGGFASISVISGICAACSGVSASRKSNGKSLPYVETYGNVQPIRCL